MTEILRQATEYLLCDPISQLTCTKRNFNCLTPRLASVEEHMCPKRFFMLLIKADTSNLIQKVKIPEECSESEYIEIDNYIKNRKYAFEEVSISSEKFRNLKVNAVSFYIEREMKGLPILAPQCKHLTLYNLRALNYPRNLKTLHLYDFQSLTDGEMVEIGNMHSLESLSISMTRRFHINIRGLPMNLRVLNISDLSSMTFVEGYSYNCPYLLQFKIRLSSVTGEVPKQLLDCATETVNDLWIKSNQSIDDLIKRFTNLRKLTLSGRRFALNNLALEIEHFTIFGRFATASMKKIRFDKLNYLHIQLYPNTDALLYRARNLKTLKLSGTHCRAILDESYPSIKNFDYHHICTEFQRPFSLTRGSETFPNLVEYTAFYQRQQIRETGYVPDKQLKLIFVENFDMFDCNLNVFEKFSFDISLMINPKLFNIQLPLNTTEIEFKLYKKRICKKIQLDREYSALSLNISDGFYLIQFKVGEEETVDCCGSLNE